MPLEQRHTRIDRRTTPEEKASLQLLHRIVPGRDPALSRTRLSSSDARRAWRLYTAFISLIAIRNKRNIRLYIRLKNPNLSDRDIFMYSLILYN